MKKTIILACLFLVLAACGQQTPPPPHKPPMPSMSGMGGMGGGIAQPQRDALEKAKTVEGTVGMGAEQRKDEANRQGGY